MNSLEPWDLMPDRLWPEFNNKVYTYLKTTLSAILTKDDLDVLVKLIATIFGPLYMRSKKLPWEIDIDRVSDENLESLSTILGYRWNSSLTADQQRESIKLFCLIRSWRGTKFGLANLIRVFGQDTTKFYSSSDLRGVEIIEYGSGGPETIEPNMFPGDIRIKIPDMSTVLRDSIFDTKLAGTRLLFLYYIYCGIFHLIMTEDFAYNITYWVSFLNQGVDPRIDQFGSLHIATKLDTCINNQLTHTVIAGKPVASVQILTYYKKPWNNGFILNVPGLTNYRGFIESKPTIVDEHILYG